MPAHLRDIHRPKCAHWSCSRYATKTLHNTWNEVIAHYCSQHAQAALRDFQQKVGER